jgi:hypothetical protein
MAHYRNYIFFISIIKGKCAFVSVRVVFGIPPVLLASKCVAQGHPSVVRGVKNIGLKVVDTLAGHAELRLRNAKSVGQLQAATK